MGAFVNVTYLLCMGVERYPSVYVSASATYILGMLAGARLGQFLALSAAVDHWVLHTSASSASVFAHSESYTV